MNGRWAVSATVGVLCGYLSGYVIGHTRTNYAVVVRDGRASWFGSGPGAAAVVAALIAVVVVVVLGRFRARYLVAVAAGLAGLAMVVAIATLQSAGTWSEPWVLGSIGAGLLIAVAVIRPAAQVWFVVGSVIAVLYGARIDESVALARRYADYLPTRTVPDLPESWPLLVAAVIALLTAGFVVGRERIEPVTGGRAVAVGAGIPLVMGALIMVVGQLPGNPSVTVAVLAVAGTVAVSWWLPRADAIFALTMLAVSAAIAVDPSVTVGPGRVGLSIQVGVLVLGALVAMVARRAWSDTAGDAAAATDGRWAPVACIGLLGLVTLSGLAPVLFADATFTDVVFRYVLPAAIGLAVGASLPAGPLTVIAVSVFPVVARLFENSRVAGELDTGWTAYVPDTYSVATDTELPIIAATVVILGCALLAARRRPAPVDTDQC
ncbi:hypothetical protein [Nocardia neocaledoniensis]|uniref:hypothetical protein n=1 Tax=Nocardia neocaledoniensis TaxID=236511 RepID=UPI00245581DD|nr:hypothetical protein [Nocardia neocaledoniensis]